MECFILDFDQHVFTYIDTDFLIKAVDEDSFKSDKLLHKAAKS